MTHRFQFEIPEEVHRELKRRCLKRGIPVRRYLLEALEATGIDVAELHKHEALAQDDRP